MVDVGLQARWRPLKPKQGGIPDLVVVLGLNYFSGFMKVGVNMNQQYADYGNGQTGVLAMRGAPVLGWDIFVISPEVRVAWNVAWFHPYFGIGFDFSMGEVDGGLDASLGFRDTLLGLDEAITMKTTNTMEIPRIFGFRPTFGLEFDLGSIFRIVLEANLELTAHQKPNPNLAQEIKDDMAGDGGYLYNKANAKSGGVDPLSYAFGLGLRFDFEDMFGKK